ncbi:hypothetical protein [Burkholderia cenocepacia]|uniref:hypothetical protein n=1 Tax=Burkholderia cenocepacia TaxID=95486 RepID=UPI000761C477|nr:hypothetical protein [Burkholderia cenocepacia]KWU23366.1 hypothetical protein AS149_37485 [Burkholderia cenocepacia]
MIFDNAIAAKLLGHSLLKLFSRETVMAAIGMEADDQGEDFWKTQTYTVVSRFYAYVLHQLGLPLTLDRENLTLEQFGLVTFGVQSALREGTTYLAVRDWWLCEGQILHNAAFSAKREAERLAKRGMRVMVFFDAARPRFLADGEGEFTLTTDNAQAKVFPVLSATQLTDEWKANMAAEFGYLLSKFPGATGVKLV